MSWIVNRRGRHSLITGVVVGAALSMGAVSARAESAAGSGGATVLGDSIGVGISMAAGLPRLAHTSVTIRSVDALRQIGRLPPDSVAVLSSTFRISGRAAQGVDPAVEEVGVNVDRVAVGRGRG